MTLPAPKPGWGRRLCHVGSDWCLDRTLRPPARVPSPVSVGLFSATFPAIVLERTEPPIWPCPCSCVPSCHIVCPSLEGTHPATRLSHPRLSVLVKGSLPQGLWCSSLGTLSSRRLKRHLGSQSHAAQERQSGLSCALPASTASVLSLLHPHLPTPPKMVLCYKNCQVRGLSPAPSWFCIYLLSGVFLLHLVCVCPLPPCPLLPSLME